MAQNNLASRKDMEARLSTAQKYERSIILLFGDIRLWLPEEAYFIAETRLTKSSVQIRPATHRFGSGMITSQAAIVVADYQAFRRQGIVNGLEASVASFKVLLENDLPGRGRVIYDHKFEENASIPYQEILASSRDVQTLPLDEQIDLFRRFSGLTDLPGQRKRATTLSTTVCKYFLIKDNSGEEAATSYLLNEVTRQDLKHKEPSTIHQDALNQVANIRRHLDLYWQEYQERKKA